MLSSIKQLDIKYPIIGQTYRHFAKGLYRQYFLYPASKKHYSQMVPKRYSQQQFHRQLQSARFTYQKWDSIQKRSENQQLLKQLTHPYWHKTISWTGHYLQHTIDENYLRNYRFCFNLGPDLAGLTPHRIARLNYIDDYNDKIRQFAHNYTESRVGNPLVYTVTDFKTPAMISNSIDQLYNLARIYRKMPIRPQNYLEIGGGYGGLARIIRMFNPTATYVIVDFPEVLALQLLYYRLNFPRYPVSCHYKKGQTVTTGALNLVPVFMIKNLQWRPDLLISTFALTETTNQLRQLIAKADFFKAKGIYIQGGKDKLFDSHKQMHSSVRKRFRKVSVAPLATDYYELVGLR
jgi:putative sugar O-methyltransferase